MFKHHRGVRSRGAGTGDVCGKRKKKKKKYFFDRMMNTFSHNGSIAGSFDPLRCCSVAGTFCLMESAKDCDSLHLYVGMHYVFIVVCACTVGCVEMIARTRFPKRDVTVPTKDRG